MNKLFNHADVWSERQRDTIVNYRIRRSFRFSELITVGDIFGHSLLAQRQRGRSGGSRKEGKPSLRPPNDSDQFR